MSSNNGAVPAGRIHYQPATRGVDIEVGAEIARRYRDAIPTGRLTQDEHRLLSDLARGRYPILAKLIQLAQKCATDDGRYALPEVCIERLTPAQAELSLPEVIGAEDAAEYDANAAVRRYTFERSPIAAQVACERIIAHERRLKRLRESLAFVASGGMA